jgi:aminoglycoside 6-adenylyltransferase
MASSQTHRDALLQRILLWGQKRPDIQAMALVGSSAREEHPADEWSDIDLVLITTSPDSYLLSTQWLVEIDELWIATVERDPTGKIVEQRVLFKNGIDVDFLIFWCERLSALQEEPTATILQRGVRVLLDKDGIGDSLTIQDRGPLQFNLPTEAEFHEVVNDFWFHAVWTAKKWRRGEFWTAKSCCDVYMKRLLLKLIEWHTHSRAEKECATWYNGRFIEQWAGAEILKKLPDIFAHYDKNDIWNALLNTSELFNQIARDIALDLKYVYEVETGQSVLHWLTSQTPV